MFDRKGFQSFADMVKVFAEKPTIFQSEVKETTVTTTTRPAVDPKIKAAMAKNWQEKDDAIKRPNKDFLHKLNACVWTAIEKAINHGDLTASNYLTRDDEQYRQSERYRRGGVVAGKVDVKQGGPHWFEVSILDWDMTNFTWAHLIADNVGETLREKGFRTTIKSISKYDAPNKPPGYREPALDDYEGNANEPNWHSNFKIELHIVLND